MAEKEEQEKLIRDQREANERMVSATIHALDLTDEAEAALERAEDSERQLRSLSEFRETFIGILGHDLRNPLASIRMLADVLLKHDRLDEHDKRAVTLMVTCSQRMSRMITQLLDLTRARLGGGFPLEPKPTDLNEVCREIVEEFAAGAVRLEVEGDLEGVWDADRLAEVLSNVASNAIEHAAPGTPVVVKAHSEGAEVAVEITNQGEPIPEELLPFIFEPFRQGRPLERSKKGNLGLGLYIAREVVRSHGGRLDVSSRNGTTTFVIHLPRHAPGHAPARQQAY